MTTCGTHDTGGVNAGVDTVVSVFDACGGSEIACDDDGGNCGALDAGTLRDSRVAVALNAGQQVRIRVSKFGASSIGGGTVRLNASYSITNNCAFLPIAAVTGANPYCNIGAELNFGGITESVCAPANPNIYNAVWFRWIAPGNGDATFDTCTSTYDTKIAIYTGGCPIFSNSATACNDDAGAPCGLSGLGSRITIPVIAGTAYLVRAGAYATTGFGTATLNISFTGTGGSGVCCIGAACVLVDQASCTPPGDGVGAVWDGGAACNDPGVSTTPCCFADVDKSGATTVDDIFIYLNSWFAASPYATVGGDGVATPTLDDIFVYLNAWFAGC